MIKIDSKGDFSKSFKYLERLDSWKVDPILHKYGKQGVNALAAATPVDSGETANSWNYTIKSTGKSGSIHWNNTHVNNGVNIAVILQYGHGTGTGGYVPGRDYINPAIRPIFDAIARDAWNEVTKI